jgi:undecaprenyl-diphosphatase
MKTIQRFLALDERLSQQSRIAERPGLLRTSAAILAHSGDSWFWLSGLLVLWLLGNAYWKERATILIVGILVTAVLVMTVKFTIRRKRPAGEWGASTASQTRTPSSGRAARPFC